MIGDDVKASYLTPFNTMVTAIEFTEIQLLGFADIRQINIIDEYLSGTAQPVTEVTTGLSEDKYDEYKTRIMTSFSNL